MNLFSDKIVWVTGASSGIGLEMVRQLSHANAKVILSARNVQKLDEVRLTLLHPENHLVLSLDLEDSSNYEELVRTVIKKYGRIDFLFNNGGLSQRSEASATPLEVDRRIMEINYFG